MNLDLKAKIHFFLALGFFLLFSVPGIVTLFLGIGFWIVDERSWIVIELISTTPVFMWARSYFKRQKYIEAITFSRTTIFLSLIGALTVLFFYWANYL